MLTFKELIELKENVDSGKITIAQAQKYYFDNLEKEKRSWHTDDWKERRKEFLKDACEICGGIEILTIQHLSHPKKYNEHKREVTKEYNWKYKETISSVERQEFIYHVKENFDYDPSPLCPKCFSRNPNERIRKKPRYLCRDRECHHEFDEPAYKTVEELIDMFYIDEETADVKSKRFTSRDEYQNVQNLNNIRYWLLREKAKDKYGAEIEKETFLRTLNDNIKYLSFEDAITACKKCASNYDLNNMELCPKCKKHYKGIPYPTCINCLPEDKRKAALEKIEFGKAWQEMHKELGID